MSCILVQLRFVFSNFCFFFFFNDTATTEIYTLSLHDALPIYSRTQALMDQFATAFADADSVFVLDIDRKSTRLNSSHVEISYAVFCLKKKKKQKVSAAKIRLHDYESRFDIDYLEISGSLK